MRSAHYLLNYLLSGMLALGTGVPAVAAGELQDAAANDAAGGPVQAAAASARPGPAITLAAETDLFGAQPIATERLARLRGGTDTVSNDMNLGGTVANNTAINVVSGMNIISNGSFSNASGLPVAIQNSGANVLIQNATIINVQLQ